MVPVQLVFVYGRVFSLGHQEPKQFIGPEIENLEDNLWICESTCSPDGSFILPKNNMAIG